MLVPLFAAVVTYSDESNLRERRFILWSTVAGEDTLAGV